MRAWMIGVAVWTAGAAGEGRAERLEEARDGSCVAVHARGEIGDGCTRLVRARADRIELLAPIAFEHGKATIRRESFAMLRELAAVMRARPGPGFEIQGHTGFPCDHCAIDLSQRRAQVVARFLVEHGVAADRIEARGYGDTRPLVRPRTDADRVTNTRVEVWARRDR